MLVKEKKANNKNHSPKKKPEEKLSEQDLKELMGMDRPTYKRVRGAIRNK